MAGIEQMIAPGQEGFTALRVPSDPQIQEFVFAEGNEHSYTDDPGAIAEQFSFIGGILSRAALLDFAKTPKLAQGLADQASAPSVTAAGLVRIGDYLMAHEQGAEYLAQAFGYPSKNSAVTARTKVRDLLVAGKGLAELGSSLQQFMLHPRVNHTELPAKHGYYGPGRIAREESLNVWADYGKQVHYHSLTHEPGLGVIIQDGNLQAWAARRLVARSVVTPKKPKYAANFQQKIAVTFDTPDVIDRHRVAVSYAYDSQPPNSGIPNLAIRAMLWSEVSERPPLPAIPLGINQDLVIVLTETADSITRFVHHPDYTPFVEMV